MRRVPEREAAKAAGERFYCTGKPCRNGHISKRYTANGLCAVCAIRNTTKSAAKRPEHPARIAARAAGERHYSTGVPCKHGHDRRFVANGCCVACSLVWAKKWKTARPGYEAAAARERRAKNPQPHRDGVSRYARRNRPKMRARDKAWRDANRPYWRQYMAIYANIRRTRLREGGGSFTAEDVKRMLTEQHGCCKACGRDDLRLEVDHIVPVVKGGSSDPSNLQLLCGPCNKSKGSKDHDQWLRELGNARLSCQ